MHESVVCTIGHSNRSIEDFVGLFWANKVAKVIDARTIPRSRHNPQFNLASLPASLVGAGLTTEQSVVSFDRSGGAP